MPFPVSRYLADRVEQWVVAESGNLDAEQLGRPDDQSALGHLDLEPAALDSEPTLVPHRVGQSQPVEGVGQVLGGH